MAGIVGFGSGLVAIQSGTNDCIFSRFACVNAIRLDGFICKCRSLFYYLFHEFALIPTFIMIGIWGGVDRRSIAPEITVYLTLSINLTWRSGCAQCSCRLSEI